MELGRLLQKWIAGEIADCKMASALSVICLKLRESVSLCEDRQGGWRNMADPKGEVQTPELRATTRHRHLELLKSWRTRLKRCSIVGARLSEQTYSISGVGARRLYVQLHLEHKPDMSLALPITIINFGCCYWMSADTRNTDNDFLFPDINYHIGLPWRVK